MTADFISFTYRDVNPSLGAAGSLPYLPIQLDYQGTALSAHALVGSGSALNVMPYDLGIRLGASWESQAIRIPLTGTLADTEARALMVAARIGNFPLVNLAFAWSQSDRVPLILGQVNFFSEFDICFHRSENTFKVKPKAVLIT